jgi:hypothetical protein
MSTAVASRPDTSAPRETTTALAVKISDDQLAKLEMIASDCGMLALTGDQNRFHRALKLASGVRQLKESMTPELMSLIMDLQGTSLGFRTDKDKDGGYPPAVVKECAIECILKGGQLIGNEMNIIAGRFYATKEYFTRIMREMDGLRDLVLQPGVPNLGSNGALVPYVATWKYCGVPGRMERVCRLGPDGKTVVEDTRICVRVNAGMGADAILGKAERKMRAAIYSLITGSQVSDGEVGENDRKTIVIDPTVSRSENLANLLDPNGGAEQKAESLPDGTIEDEAQDATRVIPGPADGKLSETGLVFIKKFEAAQGSIEKLEPLIKALGKAYQDKADPEGRWLHETLAELMEEAKKPKGTLV